ncbi:MAG: hypothetical protein LCH54_06205 [Bacteroidetes bacterium]|nr:hypothetical protein [Bacteroidota bacterium]
MYVILGLLFSIAFFIVWMVGRYNNKANRHIRQTKDDILNRRRKRMK